MTDLFRHTYIINNRNAMFSIRGMKMIAARCCSSEGVFRENYFPLNLTFRKLVKCEVSV